MRIDSGLPIQGSGDSERIQRKPVGRESGLPVGKQADASGDSVRLRSLEAKTSSVADVREGRVQSLRAMMQSGKYQVADSDLADAILRERLPR